MRLLDIYKILDSHTRKEWWGEGHALINRDGLALRDDVCVATSTGCKTREHLVE